LHMILNRRFSTVRCLACGDILISRQAFDCRICRCSQQTTVAGGSEYLRFDGNDLDLVDVLVDPNWPRAAHLGRLQTALRLARQLECWLDPATDTTDTAVSDAVAWLRNALSMAETMPEAVKAVMIEQGGWPPALTDQPRPAMVRRLGKNGATAASMREMLRRRTISHAVALREPSESGIARGPDRRESSALVHRRGDVSESSN
jgi:hypothetical protein